jgi:hypothetical protein
MPRPSRHIRSVPRPAPDYGDRAYWRGTIKMSLSKFFVLCVLHQKPMHGYEVVQAVERTSNGCCSPSEGTVYPVLNDGKPALGLHFEDPEQEKALRGLSLLSAKKVLYVANVSEADLGQGETPHVKAVRDVAEREGAEVVVLPAIRQLLSGDIRRSLRRRRITAMLAPAFSRECAASEEAWPRPCGAFSNRFTSASSFSRPTKLES